jgi:hypothetical protein
LSNKEFVEIIENKIKIGSFNSCDVYKSKQKANKNTHYIPNKNAKCIQ